MKSLQNMKISTISEIKLVRRNLRTQIRFNEAEILADSHSIYSGFRSWITYFVIEQSLTHALGYLINKITKKR